MAVAGCATYRADSGSGSGGSAPEPAQSGGGQGTASGSGGAGSSPADGAGGGSAGGASAGGTSLGPASDVPVGGGKVFSDQKVVVTQPQAGNFRAFSSVCTHQGCSVNEIADGTINCPCHGSKFSVADGSVAEGPAKRPLAAKQVTDDGGTLKLS
ncbi:MAG: Rieske (2Fe-2S) protein [Actinomycetota bacterium]|nr:Rieske (2Fe-2S) protein [Actinomycetota bacterium]